MKQLGLLISVLGFSMLVSADCAHKCQQDYEDCVKSAHTVGAEKICGEILHDCKMECATSGE